MEGEVQEGEVTPYVPIILFLTFESTFERVLTATLQSESLYIVCAGTGVPMEKDLGLSAGNAYPP